MWQILRDINDLIKEEPYREKIKIEDKQITGLAIWNATKGVRAFVWQRDKQ